MIFTFYKARGLATGKSLVEEDMTDLDKRWVCRHTWREGKRRAQGHPDLSDSRAGTYGWAGKTGGTPSHMQGTGYRR